MAKVSISRAWDESRSILARDGRLFASVALALIALPAAILSAMSPGGFERIILVAFQAKALWLLLLVILFLLLMLTGQLAITRLAIGPSVTVGGAITHSVRRLPVYVAVAIMTGAALMIFLLAAATLIGLASGSHPNPQELANSPAVAVATILVIILYFFLLTRVIGIAAAVISTEPRGPIAIIRRCWSLTSGNSWRLFGFLITIVIGTGIALFAIGSAAGVVVQLLLGAVQPMSGSALALGLINALASTCVTIVFVVMLARIYVQLAGDGEHAAEVFR